MRLLKEKGRGGLLSSPYLALFTLILLILFSAISAWLPWVLDKNQPPPEWAKETGLDHPFSSVFFLSLIGVLFLNATTCTVKRFKNALSLFKGIIYRKVLYVEVNDDTSFRDFLIRHGFRMKSEELYFKNRFGLFKALPFHIGIVILIGGVIVEQSFHESGSFEIALNEMVRLSDGNTVFDRFRGLFSKKTPPEIDIALEYFDPFHHQPGYAPDRFSRISVSADGESGIFNLDRAKGIRFKGIKIYQAIPFGLALYVGIDGMGERVFHLREVRERLSRGDFISPSGEKITFYVETERPINDLKGTGYVKVFIEDKQRRELRPGEFFLFGERRAQLKAINYWAGFTYSVSPGIPAVFTGITIIVLGSFLFFIDSGVALKKDGIWNIYITRQREEFTNELIKSGIIKRVIL